MELFENIKKKQLFSLNLQRNRDSVQKNSPDFSGFIPGVPYINNMYNYSSALIMTTQPENYRNIIDNFLKNCPEQLDIVNYATTDFLSDGYYFIPDTSDTKNKKTAKERVQKAENWCESNNFEQGMEDGLFDYFQLGNVAWWYKVDKNTSRNSMEKMINNYNQYKKRNDKIKIKQVINILEGDDDFEIKMKEFKDEDYNRFVKFRHVAWSSVSILSSPLDIIGFMQSSGSSGPIVDYNTGQPPSGKSNFAGMVVRIWPPSQIIHGKYMGWDGKEYGFSPVIASLPVISQIIMLRAYAGRFFEDAGTMEKLFMFKGMNPNDPSVKGFKQRLQTYKRAYKKRGNYVGTYGEEFQIHDLNKWDKDMEFLNLYVSAVATLAANFHMPSGRVQAILGLVESTPPNDQADTAYWRFIKRQQTKIATILNTQLFIPFFGVRIKFNNSYLQDDIRKAQLDTQNVAAVMGMDKTFRERGVQLSKEKIKELFMIKEDELEKFDEETKKNIKDLTETIEGPDFSLPGNQDKKGNPQTRNQRRNEQNKREESRQMKNEGT